VAEDVPPRVNLRYEDPFAVPVDERRPDRRLRGRLAAPVTVWTSGPTEHRVGLTVSSVIVAEGEPAHVLGLLSPLSDLRRVMEETGAFVVHVLGERDRQLAMRFAGVYPLEPFESIEVEDTAFGPVLAGPMTTASCRFAGQREIGFQDLVTGTIESIEFAAADNPLAHFRGRYRGLSPDG
jgi:3-hydroxy-9,10-secoandrosta-1,3,5(10)-triene-9,17-dione monooxygenase reductase component